MRMAASGDAGGNTALVGNASVFVVVASAVSVDAAANGSKALRACDRSVGRPPSMGSQLSDVVRIDAIGVPLASLAMWYLETGRARSVVFGLVFRAPPPYELTMSRRRGRSPSFRSL
ncbi:protein of unknown function [Paraburkholderia kururiensis]